MADDVDEARYDRIGWDGKYKGLSLEESIRRVENVESLKIWRELKPLVPSDGIVLEAGSGTGRILNYLAWKTGAEGVGIDYSHEGNQLARSVSSVMGLSSEFVVGDLHCMPFSAATFELVFSDSVIEHLEDPQQAIDEMARVTKSGGVVVATTPNRLRPDGWDLYKRWNAVPYLQKSFLPRQIQVMFESSGLVVDHFFGDTLVLLRNFLRRSSTSEGAARVPSTFLREGRGIFRRIEKRLDGVWPSRWWVNLGVVGRKR